MLVFVSGRASLRNMTNTRGSKKLGHRPLEFYDEKLDWPPQPASHYLPLPSINVAVISMDPDDCSSSQTRWRISHPNGRSSFFVAAAAIELSRFAFKVIPSLDDIHPMKCFRSKWNRSSEWSVDISEGTGPGTHLAKENWRKFTR